jgi:hypothetical protein
MKDPTKPYFFFGICKWETQMKFNSMT